jgi:acylphosphatase
MKTIDVVISGRVQNVGFRAFTRRNAMQLDIRGYVENLEDGRVHAVLEGDDQHVDILLGLIKCGTGMARVRDVKVKDVGRHGYDDFDIR